MFNTGYRMLGAGAWGWSREMIWGGRWEGGGSGLGTHVHLWLIHVNVWQNQYSIVKQNKVKINIKKINKDNDVMNGKGNGNPLLYSATDIDWRFVSYMIVYMFQCHFPKSSHPRPLPQSPKDCSIHLCLFACLPYRVITTIFLNSTYMC